MPLLRQELKEKLLFTDYLYTEYILKKRKVTDIATELGVCYLTIIKYLRINGIKLYKRKRIFTNEHKKKIGDNNRKKAQDPIFLKKLSEGVTRSWQNKEMHDARVADMREYRKTDTYRKAQSKSIKRLWDTNPPRPRSFNNKYCNKFDNEFRAYIRDKFDYKCFICGKSEQDNNNRKLTVHHIDYNKNSICNGKEWAFVPLCTSCHGKTGSGKRWFWFNLLINYWLYNNDMYTNTSIEMYHEYYNFLKKKKYVC